MAFAVFALQKLVHEIYIIENFIVKNVVFNIFAQSIVCGYTLELPRQIMSTHSLCFVAKISKFFTPVNSIFTL